MKAKRLLLLLLLTALMCLTTTAFAATAFELWVSPDGARSTAAIRWYKSGSTYYLFLPGNADLSELRIGYTGANAIRIDGQDVASGASAAGLRAGSSHQVAVGKKTYDLRVMQGSAGLPAVYITTESGKLDFIHKNKKNKEPGAILFVDADGTVAYDGGLTHLKMRGNSSTQFVKKNYQIKLSEGANLCGMGKSRTWILTGNYRDKSLLRNQITFDMALYAGLPGTPEHISAELYVNNEYMGLYLLSEKIMIDDDRVAIKDLEKETEALNDQPLSSYKMIGSKKATAGEYKAYNIPNNPEDITGGYLIEFEYFIRYKEEASGYVTSRKNALIIKSPEYCSVEQMTYISSFMQAFENAIFSGDGRDPKTGKHYSELVDVDSLVAKYLIEEISKNYDGNKSSMYFFKPEDSVSTVAFAGPCWDYDSSYGSYAKERTAKLLLTGSGLWIANATGGSYWWPALYNQPDFYAAMTQTYADTFRPALRTLLGLQEDETGTLRSLDAYADALRDSADMNVIRWPRKKNPSTVANTGYTFDENIDFLKTFLTDRMNYLDELWGVR